MSSPDKTATAAAAAAAAPPPAEDRSAGPPAVATAAGDGPKKRPDPEKLKATLRAVEERWVGREEEIHRNGYRASKLQYSPHVRCTFCPREMDHSATGGLTFYPGY